MIRTAADNCAKSSIYVADIGESLGYSKTCVRVILDDLIKFRPSSIFGTPPTLANPFQQHSLLSPSLASMEAHRQRSYTVPKRRNDHLDAVVLFVVYFHLLTVRRQ